MNKIKIPDEVLEVVKKNILEEVKRQVGIEQRIAQFSGWLILASISSLLIIFQAPKDTLDFFGKYTIRFFLASQILSMIMGSIKISIHEYKGIKDALNNKLVNSEKFYNYMMHHCFKNYYPEFFSKNEYDKLKRQYHVSIVKTHSFLLLQFVLFAISFLALICRYF